MQKFSTNPPPHYDWVEYTTYPHSVHNFVAAEKRLIFDGVDVEYTLEDGRINEEVELFFLDSLFKLIHNWYCNRGLT